MAMAESKHEGGKHYHMVYAALVWAARNRATYKYGEMGSLMGLEGGPAAMREVSHLTNEIGDREHRAGRPLLNALVVTTKTGRPSKGFFEMAEALGKLPEEADAAARDEFWQRELQRIYSTWG